MVVDNAQASRELKQIAAEMGFSVDPQAYIDTLTLGERQQLELLRLLSLGAQVLILDEPTTGISTEQKESLFSSIQKLAKEDGKTVIFVSHKLSEVQELCDQVFVLRRGKLVGETDVPCPNEVLVRMMFEEVPEREARASYVQERTQFELREVEVREDRLTVHGVDLAIRAGEVFGFAGLEGSGQRLLLRTCAGLIQPDQGEMLLEGKTVTEMGYQGMRELGVAYLPAGRLEEGLVPGLTLWEHIALTSPQRGYIVDHKRFQTETQNRIERYQIVGEPSTRVEALSGGNQQRALFALLRSPLKLLLLEHPTRGLDVRSAEWIWGLLFQQVADGAAIIFYSADLDEIIDRSDRIAAFSGGVMSRVVESKKTNSEELGHLIGGEM
jgi:simple sugar transport system ATP-binding protein